jgi:exodeoxyribonuclease III
MTLRIASYNILLGGEDRLTEIAAVLRKIDADAVALLEANSREKAEALADALEMQLAFGEANSPFHVAWLSRLPVLGSENHRLPDLAKTLLQADIEWEGELLSLFATHLGSRYDKAQPAQEVPLILKVLGTFAGRSHLLVGDFNAIRFGDPVGTPPPGSTWRIDPHDPATGAAIGYVLDADYLDCYRALNPLTPGFSYKSEHPWLRLDYVFASPEMAERLLRCDFVTGEGMDKASDHLPLWAEFQ